MHDVAGFTLLEMIVALLILALVATAALPGFQSMSRKPSIDASSVELLTQFRVARSLAITRASEQSIVLMPARNQIVFSNGVVVDIPEEIEMTVVTGQNTVLNGEEAVLMFLPNGSATGLDLYLERNRERMRVSVNWLTGLSTRSWENAR